MEANFTKHRKYENAVARGDVPGTELFSAYGELVTTGAVTDHVVWAKEGEGDLNIPDAAGVQVSIVSSSADDAASGTGAQTIEIHYLDADLAEQSETITLNGTTPVNTVATDIRFVNCMHAVSFGSGKKFAGNITISNGGNTYAYASAGGRRCTSAMRRVPANKRLMISGIYAGSSSGSAAAKTIVRLVATGMGNHDYTETVGVTLPQAGISLQDSGESIVFEMPFPIAAGMIVGFEATSDKATTINAGFFGWLENI